MRDLADELTEFGQALSLKEKAGALLVGEPTGGKPSHFGEVKSFELPVSGLSVSVQASGKPSGRLNVSTRV